MERKKGKNNASSLFGVFKIPSDAEIRGLMDPIDPHHYLYRHFTRWLLLVCWINIEQPKASYWLVWMGFIIFLPVIIEDG
ncbi:MAG: hypothetical protein GQ529_09760 [Methyloprofundus sp.]|nr:hypothetical protein [Methyloprofundus sp.]